MAIYPESDDDTRLERYIMAAVPDGWSEQEARDFARRLSPRLMETINAAIRTEVTSRGAARSNPYSPGARIRGRQ